MPSAEFATFLQGVMPYCKGCGHGLAARAMTAALEATGLPPEHLCIVSDIGCVGLVDALLPTLHTVHTTHGRSTAFAAGIQIADALLYDNRLKVVVVIGDGGATIGLLHLVAAAQANVDITVVLHNNHLYGMTGGQSSGLTPEEWITSTTRGGNPFPPLDMMGILRASGAAKLGRFLATDPELPRHLREAIEHPGFACIEVLELCTAFGVKYNQMNSRKLRDLAEATGEALGECATDGADRAPFGTAWRRTAPTKPGAGLRIAAAGSASPELGLAAPLRMIVAGTAGEGVQGAASLCTQVAVELGLYATRKNDNLVTQGTGYSLSEVVLSPDRIHHTGIEVPDVLLVVSADGLKRVGADLRRMNEGGLAVIDSSLEGVPETSATVVRLPLRAELGARNAALGALGFALARTGAFPAERLAVEAGRSFGSEKPAEAVRWGARAG